MHYSPTSSIVIAALAGLATAGQMTFYSPDVGNSACGPVYQNWEKVVALSFDVFGDGSLCGRTVTATYNGVTDYAIVADKCAGCSDDCEYLTEGECSMHLGINLTYVPGIDASEGFFDVFADESVGHLYGVEWYID